MPDKVHFAPSPAFHAAIDFARRAVLAAAIGTALFAANDIALSATTTNRPVAKDPPGRFLIIVDMSSAMERNAEATQRIVGELMASGMVGHARAGDTIGLWTFNEELQTGKFPLQRWTPQTGQSIAKAAVEFLERHRYEKRARFEKVLEPLTSVVKDSERITVLIITAGSEKISGTPFDREINESYRLNYDAQRKQRRPFITILRAKDGEFIGWRVNSPPFRPEFPAFPVEPKAAEPPVAGAEAKPGPQPSPAPPTTAPPLIVVGEPPGPVSSTPTNAPTAETPKPPATQTPVTPDALAQRKPDEQPPLPVKTSATNTTAGTETPVAAKPVEPPKSDPQPPTPAPAVASSPSEVAAKPPVTQSPSSKTGSPTPVESKPVESTPPSSTVQATSAPEPEASTSTVQTAVATPSESLFNRTNLLVAGAVLLVVAFGLFYVLMRRTMRPAGRASLITRSMDHDAK
jgi:hypothetical protein